MQGKKMLLPGLAAGNIRRNGSTYFPYIGVSIFAMFTYFTFDLLIRNGMIYTLPHGDYAMQMVKFGFILLGVIMVPFLYYTNSFLIKRRKRELGLYSILGLEKKHMGIMMLWESLVLYGIVMAAAVVLGLLFSRLAFLILLNMTRLPVDAGFAVNPRAVTDAMLFYAFVTALTLFVNLVQVGKSNPVELMSQARGGEHQPKWIPLWSLVGLLTLGAGYRIALTVRFNMRIFNNFFLAVLLVVIGTYFLFTSGSIALLRLLKKKKKHYYRAENFITVSGMLYRMKKNAASLSNICIFSTMAIITAVCTVTVYLGMDSIMDKQAENTFEAAFMAHHGSTAVDRQALKENILSLAAANGVEVTVYVDYVSARFGVVRAENGFYGRDQVTARLAEWQAAGTVSFGTELVLVTLEEYNRLENADESLEAGEILLYSEGVAAGFKSVSFGESAYVVKRELDQCLVREKTGESDLTPYSYVVVTADSEQLIKIAASLGEDADTSWSYYCGFEPIGEEGDINTFSAAVTEYISINEAENFTFFMDNRPRLAQVESAYGGLLFVGVFYGLIFLICLLVIMYYKQISEGYEDQKNFEIMQKVGMSDSEIRSAIRRQVKLMFFLPLAAALLHTLIGMRMVWILLGSISFYETGLLMGCTAAISLVFAVVYGFCYLRTSRAYYRIVRQM